MVALPQTLREGQAFLDRWRGIADFVGIGGYSTRLGSISVFQAPDASIAPPAASACVLPFSDLNIWADGKAVLCCEDWNEEYVVGDLVSETIAEIWHGPRMAAVREKHLAGRGQDVALCAKCNNWREPSVGARMWNSS
jgi:hypothetical protein